MKKFFGKIRQFFKWKNIKSLCLRVFKLVRQLIFNPRFLLCFGIAWIITNGWSYAMFGIGMFFDIGWMKAVAGAYMAALWLPFTPEKIVTFAIALALRRWIFPNDKKTEEQLKAMKSDDDSNQSEDEDAAA